MAIVKRTAKNQISLPKALLDRLPTCDYFEADVEGGALLLRPVSVVRLTAGAEPHPSDRRLADAVGSGTGLFASEEDVKSYLDDVRERWER